MMQADQGRALNLITWNVHGLNHPIKRKKIITFIKSKRCDIAFLQETHLLSQESRKLCRDWVGYVSASCGSSRSRGVAILVHKQLQFKCIRESRDEVGRVLLLLSEIQGHKVILANVYAPNTDDPTFFGQLECKLNDMGDHPILMGGDFNQVMDNILDRSTPSQRQCRSASVMQKMCKAFGLVDIWRLFNPSTRDYTFYSPRHNTLSRIDYIFVSNSATSSVVSSSIGSILLSDHAPVFLRMVPFCNIPRSPRWRLNSSLLLDPCFKESLRVQINLYLETNLASAPSAGVAWEALKAFIRGHIIQHASFKKKTNITKQLDLERRIATAEGAFKQDMSPSNLTNLTRLKYELNSILTQKAEFSLFRARQKYFEDGDKAGRMLARYIKQREALSNIPAVRAEDGALMFDSKDINRTFRDFYASLYSSELQADQQEIHLYLTSLGLPTLSVEQVDLLEAPITKEEIVTVIRGLPSSKAPGLDGFTAEFFKEYAEELSPLLLQVYCEALDDGRLPPTLSEALISLILKKDKDPLDCRSYRPISLIGCDSKILAKVLAVRLDKVITSLIHPDQVGFIRTRNLVDNIRRLIDIMWASQDEASPAAALSLDAEKAFDRVEWKYLFSALEAFGFGRKFISWIKLLYANPRASVVTNGVISQSFELNRGTRQGCPLSPLLFALALEPLAAAIRRDPEFPGIQTSSGSHKLMLYADDALVLITEPERSLPSLFKTIKLFSRLSGYKVNWAKSEALPLMPYCPKSLFQPGDFIWPQSGIRYLGILFPPSLMDLTRVNFEPLLDKFKIDIERWSPMFLSLWGKANVIKMNCTPKFNYLLQARPIKIPLKYFKQFDRLCNKFLWNNKRPRLNLKKLQGPVDQGGLGVPNLLFYHYAFSLRHMMHWALPPERAPPWFNLESSLCNPLPPMHYITTKLSPVIQTHPIILHIQWVWKKMAFIFKFNAHLHNAASIWLNPKLCIGKLPFLWRSWVDRGILVLGDLYEGGVLKSFNDLKAQFHLPQHQFWKYLQLRHLLLHTFGSTSTPPPTVSFLTQIMNVFGGGHEASLYYAMMLKCSNKGSFSLKLTWEADLQVKFTEKEWSRILLNLKKLSRELKTRLVQFKILHRVYWTPSKLYRVKLIQTPECWRCQNGEGTLIHMLWSCPKIQDFWSEIHKNITQIIGCDIPFSQRLYILGDPALLEDLPSHNAEWVQTALMLGRKLIMSEWKAPSPPPVNLWHNQLGRLAALRSVSQSRFNENSESVNPEMRETLSFPFQKGR